MKVTHRVKDSNNKTVGFIMDDGSFYTDYVVVKSFSLIDNIKVLSNGTVRCKTSLPVVQYKSVVANTYKQLAQQNPFVRDIQDTLLNWKNDQLHKVLRVDGARQIGKTTELLKFGYKNYEYVIYANIGSDLYKFAETLEEFGVNTLAMERYCRNANLPHFVNSKNTLIILDEIQVKSGVYNLIRELNSKLECDLVITGSYLGQTLRKEYFQPAGTLKYARMFTLSFSEFCSVFEEERLLRKIDLFGNDTSDNYSRLNKLYSIYSKIGGYPEIVKTFIKTKSIKVAVSKIADLLDTFEKESRNYFSSAKDTMIFSQVYEEAFNGMCSERRGSGNNLVETITNLAKQSLKTQISRDEVNNAIQWLKYCGILGDCDLYVAGDIKNRLPGRRLYFTDCGLANYVASITNNDFTSVEGILTETFVYSELLRVCSVDRISRKVKESNPCFSTYENYELDFMLVGVDNEVYGIEVKTTTGDPKSLKVYLKKKLITRGVVVKPTMGGHGNKFDTIPIYTVGTRFPYKS